MSPIERRYTRLLRLYPAGDRREEMMDTLLASTEPGQSRPPMREVAALVLGGLRARAGRDRRTGVRDDWMVAVRAAVLMVLLYDIAARTIPDLVAIVQGAWMGMPISTVTNLVVVVLWAGAAVAVLRDRYVVALGLASVGMVIAFVLATKSIYPAHLNTWRSPMILIGLAMLSRFRASTARGPVVWALLLAVLLVVSNQLLAWFLPQISGILRFGLVQALWMLGLAAALVDERVTMAVGLFLLDVLVLQMTFYLDAGWGNLVAAALSVAVVGLPPVVLLCTSSMLVRRRARV